MQLIFYSLIIFLATLLGAITGAGGGAIIKPVLDFIGQDSVVTISTYSTIAVFAMCLSSIYKHSRHHLQLNLNIILGLGSGSLLGGLMGDLLFKLAAQTISNQKVTLIQSSLLLIVLLSVLIFNRFHERLPKYRITNLILILLIGIIVGTLSVFLGIGGGPINIIVLMGLLSLTTKESTVYSIAMIFFSQIPKIIKLVLMNQSLSYDPWLLAMIAITAIIGGMVGTQINHRLSEKQVANTYFLMMICLLIICMFNIFQNLS